MIDFTKNDDLNKIISDNDIAIIQYGTATCMPCHSIKNRITTQQEDHKDVVAYYISLEENMEVAAQHGILSSPTVEVYIEGRLSIQKSGYFSLDEILEKVSTVSEQMKQQHKKEMSIPLQKITTGKEDRHLLLLSLYYKNL